MKPTIRDLKNLQEKLKSLQDKVNSALDEVHKEKLAIQAIKTDVLNSLQSGYFVRDEQRIVLSAPEIIIGNVDNNGILLGDQKLSKVIIRANNIDIEGADVINSPGSGEVVCKASKIKQIAVNPGVDGFENQATDASQIITLAENILIESQKEKDGCFIKPAAVGGGGVSIKSDTHIDLNASQFAETVKNLLQERKEDVKDNEEEMKEMASRYEKSIQDQIKELDSLIDKNEDIKSGPIPIRRYFNKIDETHREFNMKAATLYETMNKYYACIAKRSESHRLKDAIDAGLKAMKPITGNESTTTSISLNSENLNLTTNDDDGNIRTNKEAGIMLQALNFEFNSQDKDQKILPKSKFALYTQNITLDTSKPTYNNNSLEKKESDGEVTILSQNVKIEAADYKPKDKNKDPIELEETKLDDKGKLTVRMDHISFDSTTTDGKATGSFKTNAQKITLRGVDVDKETRKMKAIAKDSQTMILSDKMFIGSQADNTSLTQIYSDKTLISAKKSVQITQDAGFNPIITLENNLSLSGKPTFYGDTTMEGKVTFNQPIKAKKAVVEDLEAKTKFEAAGGKISATGLGAVIVPPEKQSPKGDKLQNPSPVDNSGGGENK